MVVVISGLTTRTTQTPTNLPRPEPTAHPCASPSPKTRSPKRQRSKSTRSPAHVSRRCERGAHLPWSHDVISDLHIGSVFSSSCGVTSSLSIDSNKTLKSSWEVTRCEACCNQTLEWYLAPKNCSYLTHTVHAICTVKKYCSIAHSLS